ncbi:hypothetical protein BD779DRAFT_780852 [Infundibulicybe gibba]|nr:hypothetical protein BD779DRAFT_780852 [Infundibulicybe gibba]
MWHHNPVIQANPPTNRGGLQPAPADHKSNVPQRCVDVGVVAAHRWAAPEPVLLEDAPLRLGGDVRLHVVCFNALCPRFRGGLASSCEFRRLGAPVGIAAAYAGKSGVVGGGTLEWENQQREGMDLRPSPRLARWECYLNLSSLVCCYRFTLSLLATGQNEYFLGWTNIDYTWDRDRVRMGV